jgi:hypothetical protein
MKAGRAAGPTHARAALRRQAWSTGIVAAALFISTSLVSAQPTPRLGTAKQPAAKAGAAKAAGQLMTRRLFVSGSVGGIAEIRVPADWEMSGRSTPIDIRLTRPGSRDYMRITALPVPRERMALMTDAKLQDILREGGAKLLALSVEKSIIVEALPASAAKGYYYALTNKKLVDQPDAPDNFRSMHAGMVPLGGWMAVFNIFSNSKDGGFVRDALAAAASLRWADPAVQDRAAARGLAGIRLANPPPAGLQAKDQVLCVSPQAHILYARFNDTYQSLLGVHAVRKSFETFDAGQGDIGSVLYMEFDAPLKPAAKSFIAGLLWGQEFPTPEHPEDFFSAGKELVIWCTRIESRIKRLSQARLESALFPPR